MRNFDNKRLCPTHSCPRVASASVGIIRLDKLHNYGDASVGRGKFGMTNSG